MLGTGTIQKLEQLRYMPMPIDSFVLVRSVGTFARALDCSSSVKQPSLHMSAAAASRDITQVFIILLKHGSCKIYELVHSCTNY